MSAVKQVEINGKSYPVRYDINALCEFEELTGKSLINGKVEFDLKGIRAMVYVGLKSGHCFNNKSEFQHTIQEVGSWLNLTDGTFNKFMGALNESVGFDTESTEENKEGEKPGE
jgi:hypothetical protein